MITIEPILRRLRSAFVVGVLVFFGTTCSSSDSPRHAVPQPGSNLARASLPWTKIQPNAAPRAETRPEHRNPWLRPQLYATSPEATFTQVLRQINAREGWSLMSESFDPEMYEAKAEVVQPLYPKWDVVRVRVTPEGSGSKVTVLSQTMERRWDLGANRRRVIGFVDDLNRILPPPKEDKLEIQWPAPRPRKDPVAVGVAGTHPFLP